MVTKVAAATYLKWSPPQPTHTPQSHSPSSSPPQTLVSAIMSSPSSSSSSSSVVTALICTHRHQRQFSSTLLGSVAPKLYRTQSCPYPTSKVHIIPRACSADFFDEFASSPSFSDEEFSKKMEELAHRFQFNGDAETEPETKEIDMTNLEPSLSFDINPQQLLSKMEVDDEEEEWGELIAATIERKANSVELPFSLRIIKRKLQWGQEASESAYCSIKKAFSSMVFMIRELHSYTLQMRQLLYYENLPGILERVQKEMHASFVWLFQQVFSHTPTLMVYVMILLANFTVHSMSSNVAIAADYSSSPSSPSMSITTADPVAITTVETNEVAIQKFDSSNLKSFLPVVGSNGSSDNNGGGKTASVGGNNGGGKTRPAASGTEDEGWFDESNSKGISLNEKGSVAAVSSSVKGLKEIKEMEEMKLWDEIVDEAERMQALTRDESLDVETVTNFVSPITVRIEGENDGGDDINNDYINHYDEYLRTELVYLRGLAQEPDNTMLLTNFAQFLYLVARDFDRAEEYFKKAMKMEPKDAEAYNKYANFLWTARNDLWAAEETFLEAIDIDPKNPFYAANYAHFLWNTGGEDTCFPIDGPEDGDDDAAFEG